jgi:hypothetical protein
MFLAIGAIAKNEPEHYVLEWLDWHRRIGVDRFYIYNNGGWTVQAGDISHWTILSSASQISAYNHCIRHCDNADFLALIDLDEFLMGPVKQRLESVENSLSLNWKTFGTSGLETNPAKRQMGVFKYHLPASHFVNSHVKSIVRPGRTIGTESSHFCRHVNNGMQEDYNGKRFMGAFNPITEWPAVWINHYWTRSKDDWRRKAARGRCDGTRRDEDEADKIDRECTVLEDRRY